MPVRGRLEPVEPRPPGGAPRRGLAASQLRRRRSIVDTAVRLAEKGGFDAVRLRDVAQVSDVALGTLYKYFHSKEDILLFALNEEVERLEAAIEARPPAAGAALARVSDVFERATRGLTRKPHFARALLRSLAAGHHETAARVAAFHSRMTRLILAALRGEAPRLADDGDGADGKRERQMAFILQNVWFASLVGWAGGLHPARTVSERVRTAAALMSI